MPEFYETNMGRKFYQGDIPRIADSLEKIADKLPAKNQSPTVPRVVVYVEGGIVHNVHADTECRIVIIDYDTDGVDDEHLVLTKEDEDVTVTEAEVTVDREHTDRWYSVTR